MEVFLLLESIDCKKSFGNDKIHPLLLSSAALEIFRPVTYIINLAIPRSKLKSYGDRAFSVCAPKLWNDIPEIIKCSVNLKTFNSNLKTYLFKRYFNE